MEIRKYETVMIFDPSLGEAQLKDETARFQKLIEGYGGSEVSPSLWGKKELAFSMKKHKYGTYVSFNFRAPGEGVVDSLTGVLRITDNVLKFETHRINERVRKFRGNPKRKNREGLEDELLDSAEVEF